MLCNVGSQHAADTDAETDATPRAAWPAGLAGQIKAVADALAEAGASLSLPELAARFNGKGRWRERLPTILDAPATRVAGGLRGWESLASKVPLRLVDIE